MVMNEYRLESLDPNSQKIMEEQMEQFFFGEGAKLPEGYVAPKAKVSSPGSSFGASRMLDRRPGVIENDSFSCGAAARARLSPACSPRKKKSQVARAIRPGSDGIAQPGGDRQSGDPRNRTSGIFSGDAFQNPALWNWKASDAGGNSFARRIPAGRSSA